MKLEDFQNYEARIKRMISSPPRHKLLFLALNEEIFPLGIIEGYKTYICKLHNQERINFIKKFVTVTKLFWIKAFFEYSNGTNYIQVFHDQFANCQRYDQNKNSINQVLNGFFNSKQSLLEECWIIHGQEHGRQSQIWETLSAIIQVASEAEEEDLLENLQNFTDSQNLPEAYRNLIDQGNRDFLVSIRALCQPYDYSNSKSPWLRKIADARIAQNRDGAIIEWKLHINGRSAEPVLAIERITVRKGIKLTIQQQNKCLLKEDIQLNFHVLRLPELQEMGLDFSQEFAVVIGNSSRQVASFFSEFSSPDSPSFFRYPENGYLLPRIKQDHIYASRIAVLWADDPQTLLHGITPLLPHGDLLTVVMPDGKRKNLQIFGFENLANNEPMPLNCDNNNYFYVGAKPFINVSEQDDRIGSNDVENLAIVTKPSARLKIQNYRGSSIQWWINGVQVEANNGVVEVGGNYGEIKKIKCKDDTGREICVKKLQFLPPLESEEFRNNWTRSQDIHAVSRLAKEGLELGAIQIGASSFLFIIPITQMVWWWQRGILGEPEGLNERKDFQNYDEAGRWSIIVSAPNVDAVQVSFAGLKRLSLNAAKYQNILLRDLLSQVVFENQLVEITDELVLQNQIVASVSRVPTRPFIFCSGNQAQVFFPTHIQQRNYSVVCLFESLISENCIQVVSCRDMEGTGPHPIELPRLRQNEEGVWLMLLNHNTEDIPVGLTDYFNWANQNSLLHDNRGIEVYSPDNSFLPHRLGVESGSEEAKRCGAILSYLHDRFFHFFQDGSIFANMLRDKDILGYPNDSQSWVELFKTRCQIVADNNDAIHSPLKNILELMLSAGFNWCAEPKWLSWAYHQIPAAMGWNRLNENRKNQLQEQLRIICPIILTQPIIEEGYPAQSNQNDTAIIGRFLTPIFRDWPGNQVSICYDPQALRNPDTLKRPQNNSPFRVNDHPINLGQQWRRVNFSYHGNVEIVVGNTFLVISGIQVANNQGTHLDNFLDGDALECDAILNEKSEKLWELFVRGIEAAESVLGAKEERGLAFLFCRAVEQFKGRNNPGRAVIMMSVILSRLHAWLGWTQNGEDRCYPENWPLNDAVAYQLVCSVIRIVWSNPDYKEMLCKDLVPVEWLIAWFHK